LLIAFGSPYQQPTEWQRIGDEVKAAALDYFTREGIRLKNATTAMLTVTAMATTAFSRRATLSRMKEVRR